MSADTLTIMTANCMNLPIQNGNGNGTQRHGQRRKSLPLVRYRIVNAHVSHGGMILLDEPADAVKFSVKPQRADMIQTAQHWSAATPTVGRRIVFFIERLIDKSIQIGRASCRERV